MSGTSILLGGGYPWLTAPDLSQPGVRPSVVADPELGLSLPALLSGPLGLQASDGSLGRLTLPLGVAVAGNHVFVLSDDGTLIYSWDGEQQELHALAEMGAEGLTANTSQAAFAEPRRFRGATGIAAHGRLLYVADPHAHRVQVFDWTTGALVRVHAGFVGAIDVAAGRRGVYLLDAREGCVFLATSHASTLILVAAINDRRGRWSRLAVDRDDRLYLRDTEPSIGGEPARTALDVIAPVPGRVVRCPGERVEDAGAVRSRFDAPPVWSEWDASGTRSAFAMTGQFADPCGLRTPLAEHQREVLVRRQRWIIDRRRRTLEVRDLDGRRHECFGPLDSAGERTSARAPDAWSPCDLVAYGNCTLVLDERHQVVYACEPGSPLLRSWFARAGDGSAPSPNDWRRIGVDDAGALLLWDGGSDNVDRVDIRGQHVGTCSYRDARRWLDRPGHVAPAPRSAADLRVGRDGRVSYAPETEMPALRQIYERAGTWMSDWQDSDTYQCQWHLVELAIGTLPPGSCISVRTRTSNEPPAVSGTVPAQLSGSWSDPLTIVAPAQPTPAELETARTRDLLVQSGPGQYLQLFVELTGDGLATPSIQQVRLRYPYESLRQLLPAVYASPPEQREFLDRLLGVVQQTWDEIEHTATGFERFLDPGSVPGGVAMNWLASWLGIRLEGTWDDARNRRLFAAARDAYPRWGTPAAMRSWIAAYLQSLSGYDAADLTRMGVPGIVEGFVERRRLMLGRDATARLGAGEPLWGPAVERRLQLGVFDVEGEVELVSVGDPALDFFGHSAHRFRVYVPAAWVRTPNDEAILRRAIAAQAPAHASWELVLVEPRFRVGVQSTVGLDAVIGAPTAGVLACPTDAEPTSRQPHDRLGFDLVLGAAYGNDTLGVADLILA